MLLVEHRGDGGEHGGGRGCLLLVLQGQAEVEVAVDVACGIGRGGSWSALEEGREVG